MKKDKWIKGFLPLGMGVTLILLGIFVFKGESVKAIAGLCLGLGAGLLGVSSSNFVNMEYLEKHPEVRKQARIESADERNQMINQMAKAKTLDIIQWFIIGIAYLTILIGSPVWVTLICIGVFVLKFILEWTFIVKYQRTL